MIDDQIKSIIEEYGALTPPPYTPEQSKRIGEIHNALKLFFSDTGEELIYNVVYDKSITPRARYAVLVRFADETSVKNIMPRLWADRHQLDRELQIQLEFLRNRLKSLED